MINEEMRAALVDGVLEASLKRLIKIGKQHGMDCEVVISPGVEPCVIFSGELRGGGGSFVFRYKPRASVERIADELERQYQEYDIERRVREATEIKADNFLGLRTVESYVFNATSWATSRMFHVIRINIERLFEDALTESTAGAFFTYQGYINQELESETGVHAPIEATPTIEEIIRWRADRDTERLRRDFASSPNVLVKRRRGRRPRVTEARVRISITQCIAKDMPLAPKAIASILGVTDEGFRQWAIRQGYNDAEGAIQALTPPPTLKPTNSDVN